MGTITSQQASDDGMPGLGSQTENADQPSSSVSESTPSGTSQQGDSQREEIVNTRPTSDTETLPPTPISESGATVPLKREQTSAFAVQTNLKREECCIV
jgi:hypothetical protein